MEGEEFKEHARFRKGVESLPSIIRRKYYADKVSVRRKLKTKLLLGFKGSST
jgi:hypothetical protein